MSLARIRKNDTVVVKRGNDAGRIKAELDEARGEVDLLFDMLPEVYENAAGNGNVEAFTRTLRAMSSKSGTQGTVSG